jgi:uncharacterized protein YodC (DUF2158 family)
MTQKNIFSIAEQTTTTFSEACHWFNGYDYDETALVDQPIHT